MDETASAGRIITDPAGLARILSQPSAGVRQTVERLLARHGQTHPVRYEPYRMGSAFHRPADV